jgi:Mg2+ and Co2+ transporter CorA
MEITVAEHLRNYIDKLILTYNAQEQVKQKYVFALEAEILELKDERKRSDSWVNYHNLDCATDRARDENNKLKTCIDEIEKVSCGENQVAEDDSEGMGYIYKRITALKEELNL